MASEEHSDDFFDNERKDYDEENDWSEYDWQRFLKRTEKKVQEFVSLYNKAGSHAMKGSGRRIAWEAQEDTLGAIVSWAESFHGVAEGFQEHPILIITRGLLDDIRYRWRAFVKANGEHLPSAFILDLEDAMRPGAEHAALAVVGLEMADPAMALCYAKYVQQTLNFILGVVNRLPDCLFQQEILQRLFDLRELWVRFIEECRN